MNETLLAGQGKTCSRYEKTLKILLLFLRYRRRTTNIQKSKTLKNLSITSDFLNESHVIEDVKYTDIADWEDFFLTSLKRNVVAMVTKPVTMQTFDKNVVKDEELVHILPNVSNRRTNSFEGELGLAWGFFLDHVKTERFRYAP